jgi:hypothetical protein
VDRFYLVVVVTVRLELGTEVPGWFEGRLATCGSPVDCCGFVGDALELFRER